MPFAFPARNNDALFFLSHFIFFPFVLFQKQIHLCQFATPFHFVLSINLHARGRKNWHREREEDEVEINEKRVLKRHFEDHVRHRQLLVSTWLRRKSQLFNAQHKLWELMLGRSIWHVVALWLYVKCMTHVPTF